VPQHLNQLADRGAANRRAAGSVVIAFIVAALVFGGFYLGSRLSSRSTLHSFNLSTGEAEHGCNRLSKVSTHEDVMSCVEF
jgi:hypothetical protein